MNSATQSFLGRYRLVKVLGQGAMGVVYEAVDTRLNRTVAIKTVLRSHMADETTANEYASRFEREAQAAARLAHAHVVQVYDFGEHEDISYIVMEFVRGRELNQAFEAGESFTLPEAVRIMRELLQALDYAHQQGIVHRDIKPANVMLDKGGHVKLADFGVARVVNANSDRTMPGTLVGTPSYMSPEQILGLAVGSRADIFAAGIILYQFLTGKRPFSGGGPFGVQRKIVQDDPEPPSQVNPAVPAEFDHIISKALAKQPENRYETAGAFANDLERALALVPRDVPLIDLDLEPEPASHSGITLRPAPAPGPAASPKPPSPSLPPAVPPDAAADLSLITAVPFGAKPPVAEPPAPRGDPDATVLMFRSPGDPTPTATIAPTPGAAAPPARAPMPPARPVAGANAPAQAQPAPHASAVRAMPPAPAVPAPVHLVDPNYVPTQIVQRPSAAGAVSPQAARASTAASARKAPLSRTLMPLSAGAALALLGLAAWLMIAKPWAKSPSAPPASSESTAADSQPAAPPTTNPTPPAAAPATPPSPAVTTAPPATAPDAAASVTASPTRPAAPTTTSVVPAAPRPVPARPAPEAPKAAAKPDARPAGEPRCSDLLQRMQLGEPLTSEQTAYFQSRCTR